MEFTFETAYNQKALAVMARALRKTVRKKRSRRSHIFGWIVMVLGLLLSLPHGNESISISTKAVVTWLAVLLILIALIWEDQINGYFARKRLPPGTDKATATFRADGFHSVTELGESNWHYDKINLVAETPEYFAFVFSNSHAQVYDKSSISGGTVDDFRKFIEEKTGNSVQQVK